MTHPLSSMVRAPGTPHCDCPSPPPVDHRIGSTESDVAKGAAIAIGVAAAACSVVPGVGTAACAAGAAIASAFVAIGTAVSAGLRDTYHPSAALCAAQLAVAEALPSALFCGWDTLTVGGFNHTADLIHPKTGTPAADAVQFVWYCLFVTGIRHAPPGLAGHNPRDMHRSGPPDPAWPLTDAHVVQRILTEITHAGGDLNSQSIQPLPRNKKEAWPLLVVLRSSNFRDSGILGLPETRAVLPGLRRNAGRLMALAGERGQDPVLSALLGGPVGAQSPSATDPEVGAMPTTLTIGPSVPCPQPPSRIVWFALGALAALATGAGLAVRATSPTAQARALADALDAYASAPSSNALDRVNRVAAAFRVATERLHSVSGHEAATLAARQVSALERTPGTRSQVPGWTAAWRAWHE